mgnify:CR=1 FL=1
MTYTYSKHYEQAKYCLIDEHTRIPEVQLISRYTWDKLSDEDKAIISECAKESAVYERDIWKNTEEAAVKMIEDKDITVTKVSDEEKQNLREKLQPIYDKYCSNYIDIIKEIEKKSGVTMSLKRKFQYVYTISSAVIAAALVLGILLSVKGMDMLTNTLDNNEKAIELYRAVTKEHNTLKLYFEDAQTILPEQIDEVRNDTKRILKKIPADYNGMNEEQYIVIQSIHNTYDSYDTIYRSITESNLSEKEYRNAIDNCYKAQNYLEDYVKKYESITVSLGNEQYNGQKKLFYIIPVILYYYCICSNCIVYMDKAFYEPEHRKTNFNAVG